MKFELKENNFYGGENLGSLESEVVGSIQVNILNDEEHSKKITSCLLYTSPSPRDDVISRMPSSA